MKGSKVHHCDMPIRLVAAALLFALGFAADCIPAAMADDLSPAAARELLLTGKYAEAEVAYEALAEKSPATAAVGVARALQATGDMAGAAQALAKAAGAHPDEASLHAELATAAFLQGDYPAASAAAARALEIDKDSLQAHWVQAELARTAGNLDEAQVGYNWFVQYYNDHEIESADDLRWIGLGAAQFARWNRLSDQFHFLVQDLYPDALKLDKQFWPARYEAGLLYLEKYNQADASRELKGALAINPNAAEAHAALAHLALQNYELDEARRLVERALEINPGCLSAHHARADLLLANFQTAEAITALEEARKLNPVSEQTLGRLAAAYAVADGAVDVAEPGGRLGEMISENVERNPHCGEFFHALASGLDRCRKFPTAARYYRAAVEHMPQLTSPRGELGLMYLRLGDEVEAKRILDESFEVDPFNVRVSNSLKVLEVLEEYAVMETAHFVIKFDRVQDEILATYAARYLEDEVYPTLVARFGFEPPEKSLFEFFHRSRNSSGHSWFSARMVGLPYVGTVGACAGKMVALASPNDMPKKYNWARVLKHEFVHVLNLQQTEFNIPHWFTEALAVESEGYPRPQTWNDLLAARVPKGELFNLDTINLGFIRPKSGLDWQMAYCQSQLYAQYMTATYGETALAKMLAAYRDNLDTPAALKRSFDVEQPAFEMGYLEYVRGVTAGLAPSEPNQEMSFAELRRAQAAKPDDAILAAQLARGYLDRREYPRARKLAERALELSPKQSQATYVLARVRLVVGESEQAIALLEGCMDTASPDSRVVNLLAGLKFKAKAYDDAARLYELGAKHFPADPQWTKSLARIYLTTKENDKLVPLLERLSDLDADDVTVRKKLAQLSLAKGDHASAARWASRANQVDCLDAETHRIWGEALTGSGEHAAAAEEYAVAVRIDADSSDLRLACARAWSDAGETGKAREVLEELLKRDPDHEAARKLLEKLPP